MSLEEEEEEAFLCAIYHHTGEDGWQRGCVLKEEEGGEGREGGSAERAQEDDAFCIGDEGGSVVGGDG